MSQDLLVKLKSTKSPHMYHVRYKKDPNDPKKLELKKYDPVVKQHVLYKQTKK